MSITGFIILYAVIWFITLWVTLPIGLRTQEDEGERVEGTQSGAPANFNFWKTAKIVTIWATLVWLIIVSLIAFSGLQIRDIDPLLWIENLRS